MERRDEAALPAGFGVVLDASVQRHGRVLIGGDPVRAMRLTEAGCAAVDALVAGAPEGTRRARELARRLVDAGMAHPRPPRAVGAPHATVVVPARDRAEELARCLAALGPKTPVVVVDDGSADRRKIADVAATHGAAVIRRECSGGPGRARNAALEAIDTELIAFLDSDCIPEPDWIAQLATHFADPQVGAVAPRVRPLSPAPGAPFRERFAAARSPIDLGPAESAVVPGGRVPYVPTAAIVVRRAALERAFDLALRYGEDVDLVWRLHDAGWRVRYDPTVIVEHSEPQSWQRLFARRMRYGTSAAPLSDRHPGRLAPVVLRPAPAATALLLLARRPDLAAASIGLQVILLDGRTRRLGLPRWMTLRWSVVSTGWTLLGIGHAATILAGPALLAGLLRRRTRIPAGALLLAAPVKEWHDRRPGTNPLPWTVACIIDDAAYGLGVWRGCLRHRTRAPLLPRFSRAS